MERKLLQIAVAFAGLVGVGFGLAGVVFGTAFVDIFDDGAIDSSVRFFKGMLLAIGLIYWSCIPDIERRGERFSLVTFILVCGAASRLMAVIGHGVATLGILVSLIGGIDPGAAVVAVATPRRASRAARCVHLNETRRRLDFLLRWRAGDRLSRAVRLRDFHRTRSAARRSDPYFSQARRAELFVRTSCLGHEAHAVAATR